LSNASTAFVLSSANQDEVMVDLAKSVDILRLFADATRIRLVHLLDEHELSVAEITQITDLPQSRASTHLGKLRDAGVLRDRRQGTSTFFARNDAAMPEPIRRVWALMAESRDEPLVRNDRLRCQEVLRARHKAKSWPESVAGQMDRHYSPGRTWEATLFALLGFIRLGDVLDGGSGDGATAALLAPHCRSVTCLDLSPRVLQAARQRLARERNVAFAPGDVQALPFPDRSFDQVLLLHVLTYAKDPALALREAGRVLRPGGALVVSTLARHEHKEVTAGYGHVNPGFSARVLHGWLAREAGLQVERCEVTSREKRPPHFSVITAFARKPNQGTP
jgi:ubiquinone/menaquinone biosynthesis C-methylase UbiE/DNA-binding transcriptional ArsR family regulator